jgi:hypothetical protein
MFIVHTTLLSLEDDENPANSKGIPTPSRLSGTTVVSLTHIRQPPPGKFFFILNDLSIRQEGHYRLKFRVFEVPLSHSFVYLRGEVKSDVITVYSPKKFPGLGMSSNLIKDFALKGHKVRVRKESTIQKRRKKKLSPVVATTITQSINNCRETNQSKAENSQQLQPESHLLPQRTEQFQPMHPTVILPIHPINSYLYLQNCDPIVPSDNAISTHSISGGGSLQATVGNKNVLSKSSSPQVKLEYISQTVDQQLSVPANPFLQPSKRVMRFVNIDEPSQQQVHYPPFSQLQLCAPMQQVATTLRYTYPDQQQHYSGTELSQNQLHQSSQLPTVQQESSSTLLPCYKIYPTFHPQHQVQQQLQPQQYFSNPTIPSPSYLQQQFIGVPPHGFISSSSSMSPTNVDPTSSMYTTEQHPY